MDSKDESSHVWPTSADHEQNTAQVHFVPDAGTVAQIVYTDDQVRPPQQVVYTADGTSYTSVDGPEHTLVYIHPVEAAQACEEWVLTCLLINTPIIHVHYGSAVVLDVWFRKHSDKICAIRKCITDLAVKEMVHLFKLSAEVS